MTHSDINRNLFLLLLFPFYVSLIHANYTDNKVEHQNPSCNSIIHLHVLYLHNSKVCLVLFTRLHTRCSCNPTVTVQTINTVIDDILTACIIYV